MKVQIGKIVVTSNDAVKAETYEVEITRIDYDGPPLKLTLRQARAVKYALDLILDPATSQGLG
jgi:hypothetical protein